MSRHERQGDAPAAVRGRTFARYETIFRLCWVGGAGLATAVPFASRGGMRTLAAIAGTGIVLALRGLLRAGRSHAGMVMKRTASKGGESTRGEPPAAQTEDREHEDVEFSSDSGAPRPR